LNSVAWKDLRGYSTEVTASFEATVLAGKCCDLLGRMRQLAPYTSEALAPLARDARFTRAELRSTVVPALEALGVFQTTR
jgi:hypothetical protein